MTNPTPASERPPSTLAVVHSETPTSTIVVSESVPSNSTASEPVPETARHVDVADAVGDSAALLNAGALEASDSTSQQPDEAVGDCDDSMKKMTLDSGKSASAALPDTDNPLNQANASITPPSGGAAPASSLDPTETTTTMSQTTSIGPAIVSDSCPSDNDGDVSKQQQGPLATLSVADKIAEIENMPQVNCAKTPVRTAPSARAMENLLGCTMKCTLDDGRTVTGTFLCIDRLKNIIMSNAVEERQTDPAIYSGKVDKLGESTITVTRNLSQAMIPGRHLVKVEIDQELYDNKVKPIMNEKS